MKYQVLGERVVVTGIRELGAANAKQFRDKCHAAIGPAQRCVEVDLAETVFLDSWGLGALLSLHKTMSRQDGVVRLLRPRPEVQQLLELTRIHQILEILPAGLPPHGLEMDCPPSRCETRPTGRLAPDREVASHDA